MLEIKEEEEVKMTPNCWLDRLMVVRVPVGHSC